MTEPMWWTTETADSISSIFGENWFLEEAPSGELVIYTGYEVAHISDGLMQLAPVEKPSPPRK